MSKTAEEICTCKTAGEAENCNKNCGHGSEPEPIKTAYQTLKCIVTENQVPLRFKPKEERVVIQAMYTYAEQQAVDALKEFNKLMADSQQWSDEAIEQYVTELFTQQNQK